MSIIEFPKKDDYLLNRLANQFYRHDELFLQLKDVVVTHKDKSAYTLFFSYAIEQGEYDILLDIFDYILPNIEKETENIEWDNAYLEALLNTWQLEKANEVLQYKWQYYEQHNLDTTYLQHVQMQLDNYIEQLKKEEDEQKAALYAQIDQVNELAYVKQQNLLPQLYLLSVDEFVTVSEQLLSAPQFHPILKSYVIEQLLTRQVSKQMRMNWFGEEKVIHLDELQPILETDMMKAILQQLPNNSDHAILEQNIIVYLSIVYPFENSVFHTPQQWIEAVQKKHLGDNSSYWLNIIENMMAKMSF